MVTPAPVTLLLGREEVLREPEIRSIERALFRDPSQRDLNRHAVSGSDTGLSEILTLAETAPFLAEKRLIILREADRLKADDQKTLLAHLKAPRFSIWVLVSDEARPKAALFRELAKTARVVMCQAPYKDADVLAWIRKKAAERKKQMEGDAAWLLLELCGRDLGQLEMRIEQLCLLKGADEKVRRTDVEALAPASSAAQTAFYLYEMLEKGRPEAAWKILKKLKEDGAKPLEILGGLIWRFERDVRIRNLLDRGAGAADAAEALGLSGYQAGRDVERARALDKRRAQKGLALLAECDAAIKRGTLEPELALERCLLGLYEMQAA